MTRAAAFVLALLLCACVQRAAPPACETVLFERTRFTVCAYQPARDDLLLTWRDMAGEAYRGFAPLQESLGKDASRVRFAMNAGMYDDSGAPIGLFVSRGVEEKPLNRRDGPGNFHMKPNGVFWLDAAGAPHVDTADDFVALTAAPTLATQSGPMLVIDGALHPAIKDDGPSRLTRNAVGVCGASEAKFVISEDPVSFGKLARFFRDGLQCPNALYLDGAVSSLWQPDQARMDEGFPIGPIIVALER